MILFSFLIVLPQNKLAEKTEHTTIYNQDKNLKSCTTVTQYVLLNLP